MCTDYTFDEWVEGNEKLMEHNIAFNRFEGGALGDAEDAMDEVVGMFLAVRDYDKDEFRDFVEAGAKFFAEAKRRMEIEEPFGVVEDIEKVLGDGSCTATVRVGPGLPHIDNSCWNPKTESTDKISIPARDAKGAADKICRAGLHHRTGLEDKSPKDQARIERVLKNEFSETVRELLQQQFPLITPNDTKATVRMPDCPKTTQWNPDRYRKGELPTEYYHGFSIGGQMRCDPAVNDNLPKNNDGRNTCCLCDKPTRAHGGGQYNMCVNPECEYGKKSL